MTHPALRATIHGYPRQGADRHLKKAIESYWAGRLSPDELEQTASQIRRERRTELAAAGLTELPSNDFSLYDHVLDTSWLLGAIPQRHLEAVPEVEDASHQLDRYFAMGRGTASVAPLEMTKWFDTNYHYLVPEIGPETVFSLNPEKPLAEFAEALADGHLTRPVILGPFSYLLLAKSTSPGFEPLSRLDDLLPLYTDLLRLLYAAGAEWVQLDEPCLVTDQSDVTLGHFARSFADLTAIEDRPKILVGTYFDRVGSALPVLANSDIEGVALDFTGPARANLDDLAAIGGLPGKRLLAGVVNGRNVWRTNLTHALADLGVLLGLAGTVEVSTSCSLLHVPLDVRLERDIDPQIVGWFAFAQQKLEEVTVLARGLTEGRDSIAGELQVNTHRVEARSTSPIVNDPAIQARAAGVNDADRRRENAYPARHIAQSSVLGLPLLPTTTIGSFPQTTGLRQARAGLRSGRIDAATYQAAMEKEIDSVLALQERIGLDVLVHGEPERNDMVQYFAEQLSGFLATAHGWVQSYGTRYVRPPVIVGDVERPEPMTVRWAHYAQQRTDKPLKGMLTGPVTMLAWSFVRDDQPLGDTAQQVALALRDEVRDLEAAGISVIQVDEPALRETLPLRSADRAEYLEWAVKAFRLSTSGVADTTQVHTHMCYAEFDDVLQAIIDMDADVTSLEAARSEMEIVSGLAASGFPNEVGPGVWDIHSPRVPSTDEIADRLRAAVAAFPAERLWVNPDCGLKTRGYAEVEASLENLVAATISVRTGL